MSDAEGINLAIFSCFMKNVNGKNEDCSERSAEELKWGKVISINKFENIGGR